MIHSLSENVTIRKGKMNHTRKRSGSRHRGASYANSCSLTTEVLCISHLCQQRRPSRRNITLKSWRSSDGMLIAHNCNWRTSGLALGHDWCKNTSKTPMLNFTSVAVLARYRVGSLRLDWIFGCKKVFRLRPKEEKNATRLRPVIICFAAHGPCTIPHKKIEKFLNRMFCS